MKLRTLAVGLDGGRPAPSPPVDRKAAPVGGGAPVVTQSAAADVQLAGLDHLRRHEGPRAAW